MISSPGPRPTTYLFIDAGHLRPNFIRTTEAWSGTPGELDLTKVRSSFSAAKVFFYDCIDDAARPGELPDDLTRRITSQEATFRRINALPNTHVRLGSITGSGKKRRQKEVDILIAVEMMNHAVRQNMNRAVLITGDRDFTPLVDTLVQFGLTVEVAGDMRATSDVLAAAADQYRPLALRYYHSWMTDPSQKVAPALLSFGSGDITRGTAVALASGTAGEWTGELYPHTSGGLALVLTRPQAAMHIVVQRDEIARLKLFLELEHGDVSWLPDVI